MSFKKQAEYYNKAYKLYKDITDDWEMIEQGQSTYPEYDITDTLKDVRKLQNLLGKINIEELQKNLEEDKFERISYNINLFGEAAYYVERDLLHIYYVDRLKDVVDEYLENIGLGASDINKWGQPSGTFHDLLLNFINTIAHPKRVKDYENEIKRLMKGKMSQKEFGKIFDALKDEMVTRGAGKSEEEREREQKSRYAYPPEMWSKEAREEFEKRSAERWKGKKGKKVKGKAPKEDIEGGYGEPSYIITPEGDKIEYDFKSEFGKKGANKVIVYFDEEGNEVYRYTEGISESYYPRFNEFRKINS